MMRFRPITIEDLDPFYEMVLERGKGLLSLPKDKELLKKKILISEKLVSGKIADYGETFTFVLENLETKEIIGTSGLIPKTGGKYPTYFYKVDEEKLSPIQYKKGPSELCGLFLKEKWREESFGKLLSFARFLFISSNRKAFKDELIAEMRGAITNEGKYPFWELFGKKYFNAPRSEAKSILLDHPERIPELLPLEPIALSSLSKELQQIISETHDKTKPALAMLLEEGFDLSEEIDLIDGGPKLTISTDLVTTPSVQITSIKNGEQNAILSNGKLDFRACYGSITKEGVISTDAASILGVTIGDLVFYKSLVVR